MSWKHTAKQKLPAVFLLLCLMVTASAFYVLSQAVDTQVYLADAKCKIKISAGRYLLFQLDSETRMVIYCNTDFETDNVMTHIHWTSTQGEFFFYLDVGTSLNIYWVGNVSNVVLDGLAIANLTNHGLGTTFHDLYWNWLGYTFVPPPTEYDFLAYAYNETDAALIEGVPITMQVDGGWTLYWETTLEMMITPTHTYKITFPSTLYYNETMNMNLYMILMWQWYGDHAGFVSSNTTDNHITFTPTDDVTLFAYYQLVTPTGLMEPLLPLTFIIGMVGLLSMFIGPLYGIHKIRQKEYRDGFVRGVIITALGFALFISWLWH